MSYDISFERIKTTEPANAAMKLIDQETCQRVLDLTHERPSEAIPLINELLERYPNTPR